MPITEGTPQTASVVQMTSEQLESMIANVASKAGQQSVTGTPAQKVSKYEQVMAAIAANPESDPAQVAGIKQIISALKEDMQEDFSEREAKIKTDVGAQSAIRDIDRALEKAFGDNEGLKKLTPYIRQKLTVEFDNSPNYAAARDRFRKSGVLDEATIEQLVSSEIKNYVSEPDKAKSPSGMAPKDSLGEQAKIASESGADEGDGALLTYQQGGTVAAKMSGFDAVFQKTGAAIRDKRQAWQIHASICRRSQ